MLADSTNYPLLDAFWTMFMIFAFVVWFWLIIMIFMDIFRSHDIGGVAKTLWVLFVIFLPVLGILVYLIARGGGMHERALKQAQAQQKQFDEYVRQTAGSGGSADELEKLAKLKEQGVITDQEFAAQKAKLLT
jgi:hypothetical protein